MKEKVKVEVLKWSQQLSSSAHNVDTFERLVAEKCNRVRGAGGVTGGEGGAG